MNAQESTAKDDPFNLNRKLTDLEARRIIEHLAVDDQFNMRTQLREFEIKLSNINYHLSRICDGIERMAIAVTVDNPNPLIRIFGLRMLELHGKDLFKTETIPKLFEKFPKSSDVPPYPKVPLSTIFSSSDQDPAGSESPESSDQESRKG